ncbi:MAG TPA: hypothetical protein EYP60_09590, partial [bacterium (Candidatus Stahlbacteria)]|nr:hypothetical protein [Candidatus Stahlbacteria bacterium]
MKLLADMPISPRTVDFLRNLRFGCSHLTEFKMGKATDEEIVKFAKDNGYTIITEDLNFGAILAYTKEIAPSVIILRVGNLNTDQINQLLRKTLPSIIDIKNCI